MTVQDFVAILGASAWQIVASVLAVITIWQAVRISRFSERLAKHEGSFDHPRLHIGIFGQC